MAVAKAQPTLPLTEWLPLTDDDKNYSDLTLILGSKTIEDASGKITIPVVADPFDVDDDGDIEDVMVTLLKAMYGDPAFFDYGTLPASASLVRAAMLYVTADKYQITSLKLHAGDSFTATISKSIDQGTSSIRGQAGFSSSHQFPEIFSHLLRYVWTKISPSDRLLKSGVLRLFADDRLELIEMPKIKDAVSDIPDLCKDLFTMLGPRLFSAKVHLSTTDESEARVTLQKHILETQRQMLAEFDQRNSGLTTAKRRRT